MSSARRQGPFARARAAAADDGGSAAERLQRARRAEQRRRRARAARWQMAFYAFTVVALGGFYLYANRDVGPTVRMIERAENVAALDAVADGMLRAPARTRVDELGALDRARLERQRRVVAELARRHIGSVPRGGAASDLRILQQLVDDRLLARDQRYELQALGVVLGDVMAEDLGLRWVIVDDEYGRTRALQYGSGDDFVFPVTMISKRYEKGLPVDVAALYEQTRREIDRLRASR